ncbi:CPBP family intramembrane glutamic endopeptidase [Jhaorihella thermophila]
MQPNLPLSRWLLLLPASLLVVLIQTSAEEILFRGYLQQQLAARFRSPLIWAVVPSVLFAAGHYVPAEAGPNAPLVAAWAGLFGLLMADLTARAGTLGPAIAVHMFNNITSLLLFSTPGQLNGLALYLLPYDLSDSEGILPWLAVDFVSIILTWLAARVAIRR